MQTKYCVQGTSAVDQTNDFGRWWRQQCIKHSPNLKASTISRHSQLVDETILSSVYSNNYAEIEFFFIQIYADLNAENEAREDAETCDRILQEHDYQAGKLLPIHN